jgi:hypothetical protein
MSRNFVFLAPALLACQCFGAAPVAAVSSSEPIIVSGITVPANRVISWPVSVNDEITTQSAPAMVRFTDGTVVTLQRNSHMRLDAGRSGVEVKMLSGSAIYDLKARSNVSIPSQGSPTTAASNGRSVQPSAAVFPVRGSSSSNAAVATALAQAPASSGIVLAAADMKTATFSSDPRARTLPTQNSDSIRLANGTILEVHLVSGGGNTGQPSVLVIDRVIFAVADPGRPGDIIYLTPPKGFVSPLIGSSLTLPPGLCGQFQSKCQIPVNLSVTLLNGTPLTPAALADLLQQTANAAFNDPNNLFLPGQTPPTPQFPSPATNGLFSGNTT